MGLTSDTLLIDVGNSRVKWSVCGSPSVDTTVEASAAAHGGDPTHIVELLPDTRPSRIAVSQVLGPDAGDALQAALTRRYRAAPFMAKVQAEFAGLRIAYDDPTRLGVDRWLAMLAARQRSPVEAVVVAMAGTALTLDVVDRHGQHLGGFIAPGLYAAQQATLASTRFDHRAGSPARAGLGATTEACVAAGARLACLGALDRGAALAPQQARRWIGGGDAVTLAADLPNWQILLNPVLVGLMAMLDPTD